MHITIDRMGQSPVYLQIRNQIREMILSGVLPSGYRLPPERKLAELLGVNRSTVVGAYRELEADALIESHVGQGTRVRWTAAPEDGAEQGEVSALGWSQLFRGEPYRVQAPLTRDLMELASQDEVISMAAGMAAPELYPVDLLREIQDEVMRDEARAVLQYGPTEGYYPLRESISRLMGSRGTLVSPEEIIPLAGSQQGLDLVARVLLDPGDVVVVEEPSFFCALQVFRSTGARLVGVPVDGHGMRVDLLEAILSRRKPKLIYTLPTFQNPSGSTMTLERRRGLLELAYRYQIPILEDDPYSELRYEGSPLPSLKSLDQHGYVIYLSTFSKMLFPGLRVGWLAAPRPLIRQVALTKQLVDLHSDNLSQRIIDRYLRRGLLEGQLVRARECYRSRRDVMLDSLEGGHLPGLVWNSPDGGIYLWCRLPGGLSSTRLLAPASRRKVAFVPGEAFHLAGNGQEYLRLNFSLPEPARIREGISRLMDALRDALAETHERASGLEREVKPIV
jgi:DNA-binding transcriptional MocR family regulator